MISPRRYLEALCFLALAGVAAGAFISPRASTREAVPIWADLDLSPRPTERTILPLRDRLGTFGARQGLVKAGSVKVDAEDRVWALDVSDLKVKRLAGDGDSVVEFGRGRGADPGQFTNPTDFSWTDEGQLWVTDPVHRRVTRFAADGELIDTVEMPEAPYRLAPRRDGGLFSMVLGSVDEIFVERGPDLAVRRFFGNLLQSEPAAIALDGWIETAGNRLIYAPAWLDVLVFFDGDAEPRFVHTLEPSAPLMILTDTDGNKSVAPKSWPVHRSLSVAGDHLGIYTIRGRGPDRRGLLDVYTLWGDYLETYALPDPVASAVLGPTTVAVLHQGRIERWRRPGR